MADEVKITPKRIADLRVGVASARKEGRLLVEEARDLLDALDDLEKAREALREAIRFVMRRDPTPGERHMADRWLDVLGDREPYSPGPGDPPTAPTFHPET